MAENQFFPQPAFQLDIIQSLTWTGVRILRITITGVKDNNVIPKEEPQRIHRHNVHKKIHVHSIQTARRTPRSLLSD
jgi:hypothetical protein